MAAHDDASLRVRDEILGVWAGWVKLATNPEWNWGDSVNPERNAVMDAEQLNCLLLPQALVSGLTLEGHREAAPDVARVLVDLADDGKWNPDPDKRRYLDERATV